MQDTHASLPVSEKHLPAFAKSISRRVCEF